MALLKLGSRGALVVRLQKKLASLGFSPGALDGDLGPGTEAALLAFQKSEGLLADGIAGPRSLYALGISKDAALPSVINQVTPRLVSEMFPFTPIGNIKANLPAVLTALDDQDLADKAMVLMALGTIRAETEGFVPISEYQSKYNTSPGGEPFDLYDHRNDLGNQGPTDGADFRGRGFVQLTGRANYARCGAMLGLGNQLVAKPERANEKDIAAQLLAAFLKDKERAIKEALLVRDFATARKLVNGGSHGLTEFADTYQKGELLIV